MHKWYIATAKTNENPKALIPYHSGGPKSINLTRVVTPSRKSPVRRLSLSSQNTGMYKSGTFLNILKQKMFLMRNK